MDKEFFKEKLNELTDNDNFECLNQDPSKNIQKDLKSLLNIILPDTEIPDCYWDKIIPNAHGQAPNLYTFIKENVILTLILSCPMIRGITSIELAKLEL